MIDIGVASASNPFIWLFAVSGLAVVTLLSSYLLSDSAPTFKIRGKRALITGGSSGIGLATAKSLASSGCSVAILARDPTRLQKAVEEIKKCAQHGAKVTSVSADVGSAEAIQAAVDQVVAQLGGIDVLITSAGASLPGHFLELELSEFDRLMKSNYLGTVYITRAVVPHMLKQGGGRVMFISSMAGQAGVFGFSAYSPSKFAVRGLAEVLHMEYRHHNIYFSVCNPPDVDTPMLREENKVKPEECRLISEGAGLFTAEQLASSIVSGLQHWRFFVSNGVDGYFLARLTAGMAPSSGMGATIFEFVFGGVLRLVALAYLVSYRSICARCARRRNEQQKTKNAGEGAKSKNA